MNEKQYTDRIVEQVLLQIQGAEIELTRELIKEISEKNDTKTRIGGTVASSVYLMMQGVQILRIHDVNELLQGLKVFKELIKN